MPKRRRGDANALRRAVSGSGGTSKTSVIAHRKFACGEALFERYYREQGVVEEGEYEAFARTLATPLPVTFRTHVAREGGDGAREALLATALAREVFPGAFEIANPSGELKRGRPAVPAVVRDAMERATAGGLGARQEIVSMLPVIALSPASGSRVLDVCAAPGQKTMQLLERVRYGESGGAGVVHANDAHPGRVKTLLDAIDRHRRDVRELTGLFVTRAFGQDLHFPLFVKGDLKRELQRVLSLNPGLERRAALLEIGGYTHILADVPCSGDGTIRKDPDCLIRWHPGIGNALHTTQLAVARRCARLLKPGGTMVYSTCTFNPVEDEAVVASLLDDAELELELEELDLPVAGRHGLFSWKVGEQVKASKEEDEDVSIRWFETFEQAQREGEGAFVRTMWPLDSSRTSLFKLERCARFLPHDGAQNTGGFFIAKLRKRDDERTRESFAALVEGELIARCSSSKDSKKLIKKVSTEDADAVLDRLVPVHRVSKDLAKVLRERFCGANVFFSIDPSRRRIFVGSSTSSAILDKTCDASVRLANGGVLLFESLDAQEVERSVTWDAHLLGDLHLTVDGVNAVRASLDEKIPSQWLPCLPTELDALLMMQGEAIPLSELSKQTQRQAAKIRNQGNVVLCLRKKSGDVVFAMPGKFDGESLNFPARHDADFLAAELRRVAKVRK